MASKVARRRRDIITMLQTEGTLYVNGLAKLFGVTPETIRSDLDYLTHQEGYIRIHGGIKMVTEDRQASQYHYQDQTRIHTEEKKQLCYRAMDLLHDGDCLYVDGGSTLSYLLNYINRRKGLTLVTPSIAFLMKYQMDGYDRHFKEGNHKLLFIGGNVDSHIMTTFGPFFDQMVANIHFDAMIFSADGVDLEAAATNRDTVAFAITQRIRQQSKKKILLVDKSKFGRVNTYKALTFDELDYLVTEMHLDEPWQKKLTEHGVVYYKA